MRIFRSLDEARGAFGPCAVSIGNFDGVHIGHRELIRRVCLLARETGARPAALTFDPHPAEIVAPERAPLLLSTPEERCRLMGGLGIEHVLILPFHLGIARMDPAAFWREVLLEALEARAVVVGDNFHFGHRQSGNVETLAGLGARSGVRVEIVPPVRHRGLIVSSSEVRRLLAEGRVAQAARLLERPYSLAGAVVRGEGRGSRETVPTLNLAPESGFVPAAGVYITETSELDGTRRWPSVTNVGQRPTFSGEHLTIETYLLEPFAGATPARIRVNFCRRLRAERKFDSAEALKRQILADVARAQAWFRRLGHARPLSVASAIRGTTL
jgi:riboflavin kinase/FMN adenylyltransferase